MMNLDQIGDLDTLQIIEFILNKKAVNTKPNIYDFKEEKIRVHNNKYISYKSGNNGTIINFFQDYYKIKDWNSAKVRFEDFYTENGFKFISLDFF